MTKRIVVVTMMLGALAAPASAFQGDSREALLVDAAWLQDHLDDPGVVVLHVGGAYDSGHIPGAAALDMDRLTYSSEDQEAPGRVRLDLPPDLATARAAFEEAGVSDDSRVVFVFEGRSIPVATRALWTLQVVGPRTAGSLLDGGFEAWKAAGGGVSTDVPTVAPGRITAAPRLDRRVDKAFVLDRGQAEGIALLDARRAAHFSGVQEEAPGRAGHIPGAGNLHFGDLFTDEGRLRPTGELEDLMAKAGVRPGDQVVAYCHIGLWASGVVFAARTLGLDAVLYDGSMTEWVQDPDLPLVAGSGGR